MLHAEHAAEAGIFDLTDVYRSIMAKIVRRHPHVFGEVEARTVGDVLRNWETIKAGERADRAAAADARAGARDAPTRAGMPAAFAGVSRSLPALAYAQEIQERAASMGYDWPDVEGVIDKLEEEALELLAADGDGGAARGVSATCCWSSSTSGVSWAWMPRRPFGRPTPSSPAGSRAWSAWPRAAPLNTMTFDELDVLWARAKREEADERESSS